VASLRDKLKMIHTQSPPPPKAEPTPARRMLPGFEEKRAMGGRCLVRERYQVLPDKCFVPGVLPDALPAEVGALSDLIFLDTETTGLSRGPGTLAFLIGLAWEENGLLVLRQ